jgi:diguanylate cyclase (GGDEF)-like protein
MPSSLTPVNTRKRRMAVAGITAVFLVIAGLLTGLTALSLARMADSANRIDEDRANKATQGAILAMRDKLESVLHDNAFWDDCYEIMATPNGVKWATDNWGMTTRDYPLYDASLILDPQGKAIMAYRLGETFDPFTYFDTSLQTLLASGKTGDKTVRSAFIRTRDGVSLIGTARIQPVSYAARDPEQLYSLTFSRAITQAVIAETAATFNLDGLVLADEPAPSTLAVPLKNVDGQTISYLAMPLPRPGDASYETVKPLIYISSFALLAFLSAILVAGIAIYRNLKRSEGRAHDRATHDGLSGLYNRHGLFEMVLQERQALQSGDDRFTLYLLDLDGFKSVNDRWGHSVGDRLIAKVSTALTEIVPPDAILARLGGDEFAIGLPAFADTNSLMARIFHRFANAFDIDGLVIHVGVSAGRATTDDGNADLIELMRRADIALYRAKDGGRGKLVDYHPDFDEELQMEMTLGSQLRSALERNDLDVHFQPLFDVETRQLVGVEALARWSLPEGPVRPDVFIGIAEKCGLIDQLGAYVMARAMDAAKQWPDIPVSVNVSPVQLQNPGFARSTLALLKAKSFPANRLVLEITEAVLISNPDQARRVMAELGQAGILFSLDDFGSGFASIGTLRKFNFNGMKIDRSLVLALETTDRDAKVLRATVMLAEAMNMRVTVEGIETETQARIAAECGCHQLQGYLLSRPVPAREIESLLI